MLEKRGVITEQTPGILKECRASGSCRCAGVKQAEKTEPKLIDRNLDTEMADVAANAFKK